MKNTNPMHDATILLAWSRSLEQHKLCFADFVALYYKQRRAA